ncbi:ABC transporter substrate-binding protein [Blastochloris viridis]|uniref:Periplasmic binding protein n=1 Tax=Blastochloris viridis TaxID=1079 RepID=A0A0H5BQ41_BLAVI|nr:ABC transporter substrate-binding protein [Blastochloris viridis]ALK09789.1 Cystine-binding periplasmic protein precursor [Blastochloris viridis]BAS00309.1 periplasmic binding protein [Blastochloris viridis]CUU42452.1 Sulfate starvation-induced protein 7 [Blastochloris viridis]
MPAHASRRGVLAGAVAAFLALAVPAFATDEIDFGPAQAGRVRATKVDAAAKLIPTDYKFVTPGKFTVAAIPNRLPFSVLATDNKTPIGSEPDIAQLVADVLGLDLVLVPIAWADWPLGLASGKFDAVIHNVTVTEERKEKFDFSTYRKDLLGFYVSQTSKIESISNPEDITGLKIIVGAGTNQEQILLRWIEANKAKALAPTELQYYDDEVVLDLAVQSGRADAYFGPNAVSAFKATRQNNLKLVGTFSGGWPVTAEIAVATRKGSGLADAVTAALNAQIANGNYARLLARWNLTAEAIQASQTNPPGLPRK